MDFDEFDRILVKHGIQHDVAFDRLNVAILPLPHPYDDGKTLGLYYSEADHALGIPPETMVIPPDCDEDTVLHELGHRKYHYLNNDLSEQSAEEYRQTMKAHTVTPARRSAAPVRAIADFTLSNLSISIPSSLNTGEFITAQISCQVDDILANFPDEWQVCVAVIVPGCGQQYYIWKSATNFARYPFDTRISPFTTFDPGRLGQMPSHEAVATIAILANHDDTVPFDWAILDYGEGYSSWDVLTEQYFVITNSSPPLPPGGGGDGTQGGYVVQAKGNSFDALSQSLSTSTRQLQHGDKVRFVLTLNQPIAHLFDVAGAELIFKPIMPPGIILDDVYSMDSLTVGIDAHATSPMFAAIGAWIAANWIYVALGVLGITIALGLLVAGISFLVLAIKSPQTISDTAKWIAIGLVAVSAAGIVIAIAGSKKKLGV